MNEKTATLSDSGYDITPLSSEAVERLAQDLNEEERRILLNHGTEPAFCGTLLDNHLDGTYACRLCGLPLFSSSHKFNSGTGWPSFYRPFDKDHLTNIDDDSYGMATHQAAQPFSLNPSKPSRPTMNCKTFAARRNARSPVSYSSSPTSYANNSRPLN